MHKVKRIHAPARNGKQSEKTFSVFKKNSGPEKKSRAKSFGGQAHSCPLAKGEEKNVVCMYKKKKKLNKTKLFLSLVRHANKALLTGRVRHFQFLLVASDQSRNDVRNDWKKIPRSSFYPSLSFFFFHFFRNNGDYDRKLMYVSAGQRVLGKEYRLVAYKREKGTVWYTKSVRHSILVATTPVRPPTHDSLFSFSNTKQAGQK